MLRKLLFGIAGLIGAMAALAAAGLWLTPWPGALAIRYVFYRGAVEASAKLEKHVPAGVDARTDIRYGPGPDELLDLYRLSSGAGPLPLIVWIHGGGFVSGQKGQVGNYLKVLAGRGYAAVAVGYSIAPGATYPTPVRQVNAALGYLRANAARMGLDGSRLILAGDSAGAQIAAQVANLLTAPDYAAAMGVTPTVDPEAIRGVILFCGPYDIGMVDTDGPFGFFLRNVLWSYSGRRDHLQRPDFALMSVGRHVTPRFPKSFVSAGNADPLEPQSTAFADALRRQGVVVDTLFFPKNHQPPLGHEYQFDLDGEAGRTALDRAAAFAAQAFR